MPTTIIVPLITPTPLDATVIPGISITLTQPSTRPLFARIFLGQTLHDSHSNRHFGGGVSCGGGSSGSY